MTRYAIEVDGIRIEFDAEDGPAATALAREQHPNARLGYAFRVTPMGEVPKKRSGNSRFHLADVDKMGSDGASPLPGRRIRGRR